MYSFGGYAIYLLSNKTTKNRIVVILKNIAKISELFGLYKVLLSEESGQEQLPPKLPLLFLHILLLQLDRIERELKKLEGESSEQEMATLGIGVAVQQINEIKENIKQEMLKFKSHQDEGGERQKILIAGSGPIALLTAFQCMERYGKNYQIVLLSDQYLDMPVRNGVVAHKIFDQALEHAQCPKKFEKALKAALTLREHERLSIKHFEMFYLANLKAVTGLLSVREEEVFFRAKFEYSSIKQQSNNCARVCLKDLRGNELNIENVAIIFNATGFNGAYPPKFERQDCAKKNEKQVVRKRTCGIQVNIRASHELYNRLVDSLYSLHGRAFCNLSLIRDETPISGKIKLQLFFFLTTDENEVLNRLVCDSTTQEERIISKAKLWAQFLAESQGKKLPDVMWESVEYHQSYKAEKAATCSEFSMPEMATSGPKPQIINGAVVVSVGDNYLPPLFGASIETGYEHMMYLLNEFNGDPMTDLHDITLKFTSSKEAKSVESHRARVIMHENQGEYIFTSISKEKKQFRSARTIHLADSRQSVNKTDQVDMSTELENYYFQIKKPIQKFRIKF